VSLRAAVALLLLIASLGVPAVAADESDADAL